MRQSPSTVFLACLLAGAIGFSIKANSQPAGVAESNRELETPELIQRLAGTIITVKPVGGIIAVDLPSLHTRDIRPANAGRSAVHQLSEPDREGRVAFVDGGGTAGRIYHVQAIKDGAEKKWFDGHGDPLWDNAISPISLSSAAGKVAFVAQPAENAGKKFQPLLRGPLRVWDGSTGVHEVAVSAAGERPSWFPDGRRLAYTATAGAGSDPSVHLVDTQSGDDRLLTEGHLPLVSSDGKRVDRQIIPLSEMAPFTNHKFRIPFDASGKKWVRFAVWDSAGNGAFTQPVHLQ